MNARDVVEAAALLAARHAFPSLPAGLVAWSDEPQAQAEGDYPQVTMTTVSLVPEGPVSVRRSLNATSGKLDVRLLQTYIWTVQFKCEGWKLESPANNNPVLFAQRMRTGWYVQAVTQALLDRDSNESERSPVKMVDEVGQILTLNRGVRGQTLPIQVYEIEFRYVDHDTDPTPIDVFDDAVLSGALEGVPATINTESQTP